MGLQTLNKNKSKVKDEKRPAVGKKTELDLSKMDQEWVKCPKCHEDLRSKNLEHHLEKVHHSEMKINGQRRTTIIPVVGVLIVIALLVAGGTYLLIISDEGDDDNGDTDTPSEGWLDDYSPKEKIGNSEDDWWIPYPSQNPNWGEIPDHPSWVTEKLQEGPVLILDHSEGCIPCIQQQGDVDTIMKNYGNYIQFLDLLSGSDPEAGEAFPVYDANGSPNYIPLTIIVTLMEDTNGNVRIGWHSIEGATGYEWLSNYVKDAIYYHHENVDEWS